MYVVVANTVYPGHYEEDIIPQGYGHNHSPEVFMEREQAGAFVYDQVIARPLKYHSPAKKRTCMSMYSDYDICCLLDKDNNIIAAFGYNEDTDKIYGWFYGADGMKISYTVYQI